MEKIKGVYNKDSFLIIHLQYAKEGRHNGPVKVREKFFSSSYCNMLTLQINEIKGQGHKLFYFRFLICRVFANFEQFDKFAAFNKDFLF
jgi:hypothetical protein